MPRLKAGSWAEYRTECAPIAIDEAALVRRYVAWRRLGCAKNVADREERWVVRWVLHVAEQGGAWDRATEDDALTFARYFDAWDWAPGTRRQCIAALRVFYDYLLDRDLAERNPWKRIRPPREVVRAPRVLQGDEIARMAAALRRPHWRDRRDLAVLLALASTGARIAEVLGLDLADIDLEAKHALVCGKGSKERYVFFDDDAIDALRFYLHHIRGTLNPVSTSAVFLGRHGRRLNADVVRESLKRAANRAGIDKHVWPHLFRHTLGTELLDNGADIRHVQQILGHTNIRSTQRYTHTAQRRLREVYDRTHGVDHATAD